MLFTVSNGVNRDGVYFVWEIAFLFVFKLFPSFLTFLLNTSKEKKRWEKEFGRCLFLYSFSVREEREGLWEKSGLYKFPGFMEK